MGKPVDDETGEERVEALRERTSELQVLCDTIRDLTSTLSVESVLERLLDRMLLHLDAEIGSVLKAEPDRSLRIVSSRGVPEDFVTNTKIPVGEGISGYVLGSAKPLLIPDIEQDERFMRRNRERYYTCSCISVPLFIGGEPRGVINVNNKRDRSAFQPRDLDLLKAISGYAATALDNAQRFEDALTQARCDALTGLANHGHFWATLAREVERSDRHGRQVAVAMFDVDHFKEYNDTHGHLEGDRALIAVSQLLVTHSRSHDLVARYGGEEFAIILPETDPEGGMAFANKVCELVAGSDLGLSLRADITLSGGVAIFPDDGLCAADLVRSADDRLYRAKRAGRNTIVGEGGR